VPFKESSVPFKESSVPFKESANGFKVFNFALSNFKCSPNPLKIIVKIPNAVVINELKPHPIKGIALA
jgi:hypothetical protein